MRRPLRTRFSELRVLLFGKHRPRVSEGEAARPAALNTFSGERDFTAGASSADDSPPVDQADLCSFVENLPGWAWIKDAEGRYRFVNRQMVKACGLEAEQWLGRRDTDLFPAALTAEASENDQIVLESGRPQSEIEVGLEGGRPRHFLVSRFPIRTAGATMVGGVGIDLTDRLRVERSLAEAREELFKYERARLISQLSSGLAHGLNNTLNAISLRLSLMKAEPALGENHPSLQRLSTLVNDAAARVRRLQEFSSVQRDRPLLGLDVVAVILGAISAVQARTISDPQTAFRITLGEMPLDLSPVLGMVPDVHHLFVNLFLHANGAMPAGGTLRVSAQPDRERVIVTIAAEGASLPESVWAGFLDPFAITTRTGQVSSADIRLPMAETLMMQLGGSIEIEKACDGEASLVLKLSFPLANSDQLATRFKAAMEKRPCRSLLLIDDDTDNLEGMKAVLELRGYTVRTATSGAKGLEMLAEGGKIDSVICDLGMPGMNGWEVAREIARIAPATPVYLVTGWADGIPSEEPRRKLVTAILAKPIDLPELEKLLLGDGDDERGIELRSIGD